MRCKYLICLIDFAYLNNLGDNTSGFPIDHVFVYL